MSRPRDRRGVDDDKDDGILRDILGDDRSEERRRVDDYPVDGYQSGRHRYATEPVDYDRRPAAYPEDHRGIRGSYSYDEFLRGDPYHQYEPEYYEPEHRRPRYDEPYIEHHDRAYRYDRSERGEDRRGDRFYGRPSVPSVPPVPSVPVETGRIVTKADTSGITSGKRRYSEEGEVSGSSSKPDTTKKFSPIVFDLKVPERLRFFTARCNYYDMFAKSKKDAVWRAPQYVVKRINQALREDCRVMLLFTVHGSQYWQGIAEVDQKRRIEFDAKLARVPLIWIALGDVSYLASPRIPDLFVEDNAVKESFEIPEEFGREFFALFDRSITDDPTRSLGIGKLKPFLK